MERTAEQAASYARFLKHYEAMRQSGKIDYGPVCSDHFMTWEAARTYERELQQPTIDYLQKQASQAQATITDLKEQLKQAIEDGEMYHKATIEMGKISEMMVR